MDVTTYIKHEIKEEDCSDDVFAHDHDDYDENFETIIKSEHETVIEEYQDDLGNYEYAKPEQQDQRETESESEPESENISVRASKPNRNRPYSKRYSAKRVACENIYIDGEPEVCIENFNVLNNQTNSAIDPLASCDEPEGRRSDRTKNVNQLTSSSISMASSSSETISIYHFKKVPPVQKLVNKTYSIKHRTAHKTKSMATPTTTYKCDRCNQTFYGASEYRDHYVKNQCLYKCSDCNLIYRSAQLLKIHKTKFCSTKPLKKHKHPIKQTKPVTQMIEPSQFVQKSCNICLVKIDSSDEWTEHQRKYHFMPNAYACHLCDQKFDYDYQVMWHLNRDHSCK